MLVTAFVISLQKLPSVPKLKQDLENKNYFYKTIDEVVNDVSKASFLVSFKSEGGSEH